MSDRGKLFIRSIVITLFFFSTIIVTLRSPNIVNSPDENSNLLFTEQFIKTQTLQVASSFDQSWSNLIHPRSTIVLNQMILPGSFLGLPVSFGVIGLLFGKWLIVFITPILAILAILAWRKSIYQITRNQRLSDLAALFLMIHPAFWYYTSRTMMHNIGFISFLIFGFYLFVASPFSNLHPSSRILLGRTRDFLDIFLAGLMIGLALAFRTSEILWIFILCAGLLIWKYKSIGWKKILIFGIGALIILTPFAALNNELYGSIFETGYTVSSHPVIPTEVEGSLDSSFGLARDDENGMILNLLFPFGIHEMNIIKNVWQYGFLLYPWMSILALLGVISVFKDRKWRSWIVVLSLMSIWLVIVYGSWKFNDNPDPDALTIGNSYVRYWLPLFTIGSVFCAIAVDKISDWVKKRRISYSTFIPWVIVLITLILSANLVIWGTDGFTETNQSLKEFEVKKEIVLENTEKNSIIIVDMADKYLYPDRNVIIPLRDDQVYSAIPDIVDVVDLYYFGITLPEQDIEHLESVILQGSGVEIHEIVTIDDETLYRFIR